ncbi:MAG: hypothetical protein LJF04_07940, partial [Gemmatimonadetes bacterium]|nr:hypothetical protein [Gemmatimonadota bacterium]
MTSRVRGSRAGAAHRLLTAALLAWIVAPPAPVAAQASRGWTFEGDAFADLWFHGLAVTGFYGFGPFPLYDPAYAAAVRRQDREAGSPPTALEKDRRDLLTSFQSSDLFEVLHFVPLYFHGASRRETLGALRAIAATSRGSPEASSTTRFGVSVVAQLIPEERDRRTLGRFVDDLGEEWDSVVGPRRADDGDVRARRLQEVQSVWDTLWAPALAGFLE